MHRVFKNGDGSIAVMVFATDDPKLIERDTKNHLEANPGSELVGEDLPLPSRRFRNAWTHDGEKVTPHLGKAREQVLAEVRAKRDKDLQASDGPFLRAAEKGPVPKDLLDKRQALRDLPAKVEKEIAGLGAEELERYASTS